MFTMKKFSCAANGKIISLAYFEAEIFSLWLSIFISSINKLFRVALFAER